MVSPQVYCPVQGMNHLGGGSFAGTRITEHEIKRRAIHTHSLADHKRCFKRDSKHLRILLTLYNIKIMSSPESRRNKDRHDDIVKTQMVSGYGPELGVRIF